MMVLLSLMDTWRKRSVRLKKERCFIVLYLVNLSWSQDVPCSVAYRFSIVALVGSSLTYEDPLVRFNFPLKQIE